jgi:hypothetical protein
MASRDRGFVSLLMESDVLPSIVQHIRLDFAHIHQHHSKPFTPSRPRPATTSVKGTRSKLGKRSQLITLSPPSKGGEEEDMSVAVSSCSCASSMIRRRRSRLSIFMTLIERVSAIDVHTILMMQLPLDIHAPVTSSISSSQSAMIFPEDLADESTSSLDATNNGDQKKHGSNGSIQQSSSSSSSACMIATLLAILNHCRPLLREATPYVRDHHDKQNTSSKSSSSDPSSTVSSPRRRGHAQELLEQKARDSSAATEVNDDVWVTTWVRRMSMTSLRMLVNLTNNNDIGCGHMNDPLHPSVSTSFSCHSARVCALFVLKGIL